MERQRKAQARHLALLSSDAPVMNRCAKEEAHLQQRLAQSTAALTRTTRQNQAAAEREERARETHLHAQFSAILSKTPGIRVPTLVTPDEHIAAAAAEHAQSPAPSVTVHHTVDVPCASTSGPSTACLLGFPEPYATSGFKSAVHWASVAYDEAFLTAYGPRRLREEMRASTVAESGGLPNARDARPHRLMAAVACYVLNEVLCADATVSSLWQEKLRQPIFDAVFSSQTIAAGQKKRRAYQSIGKTGNEAARSHAIVVQTLGAAAAAAATGEPFGAAEGIDEDGMTAVSDVAPTSLPPESPFPPRTNAYATRDDFASMRLWTEEVTAEQREKALVCQQVRNLQHVMERRMQLLQLYQRQTNEATLRFIFTMWRTHTRHRRIHRLALERYLANRHCRVLEENVFLRWRRVTLQSKVESLQRRMLNIVAEREEVLRKHAAALAVVQEQLGNERRHHQQAAYEQDALQTQILESHSMEVEALRLVLQQQRAQTAEVVKCAKRWERLAKTFRPSHQCPAVPPAMWTHTRALYISEETVVATLLGKGGGRHVLQQVPYSMVLPVRERLERLLLVWVNSVMEKSPLASSWVPAESFAHGRTTHPRSILVSQKTEMNTSSSTQAVSSAATINSVVDSHMTEFGIYTLMAFIRELRRLYILAGKMPDLDTIDERLPRHYNNGGAGGGGERNSLAKCFREVVELLSVQTCAGLYPSLLTHCPSLSRWFTPEGIFCGPVKSFEGAGRERRLQHSMFVWLLTALLVGHIRVTILGPAGEKDDGLPPPASNATSLRCTREADLNRFPQINFPVESPNGLGGPGASSASPGRHGDTNMPTSVGTLSLFSRGTSVVAQSTFLSKKGPSTAVNKARRMSSVRRKGVGTSTVPGALGSPNRLNEDTAVGLLKATVTLGTALRERSQKVGAAATDAEDSLSDIEAYLGLLSTQAQTLRRQESQGTAPAARFKEVVNAERGNAYCRQYSNDDNKEDCNDYLVNGLLQQLVGARDAAAQSRRIRRMQRNAERDDKNSNNKNSGDTYEPVAAFSNGNSNVDNERNDSIDDSLQDLDSSQSYSQRPFGGSTSAILTEGQLHVLRSLPSRSCAFDTVRPIPPSAVKTSASSDLPGTTTTLQNQRDLLSTGVPSGKFYSFLLNTLEDVTRRQQWAGLARVVTSLVVRFHVLDDVEDGAQHSNVTLPNRGEALKEEPAVAPSQPSSLSRRPPSGSLVLFSGSTASSSSAMLSQSARLPAVPSTSATEADAPKEKTKPMIPRERASTTSGAGATTNGSLTAREKIRGQRVAAKLVPSRPPQGLLQLPNASDAHTLNNSTSKVTASNQSSLQVTVANVDVDLPRAIPAYKNATSPRDSASLPVPPHKRRNNPLLSAHETRMLEGEMKERRPDAAYDSGGMAGSIPHRPLTSVDNTGESPAQKLSNSIADKQTNEHGKEGPHTLSPRPQPLPASTLCVSSFSSPPASSGLPKGREEHDTAQTTKFDSKRRPESDDLSTQSTLQEATLEESHEQMVVYVQKKSAVTPMLEDTELMESPPPASLVAPPSPPVLKDQRGTSAPSVVQAKNKPFQPADSHLPHDPPSATSQLHPGSPPSTGPLKPGSAPKAVGSGGNEERVMRSAEEDAASWEQLGFLDPLVEHGASQRSATIENIRKYRFHMQP